LDVEGIPDQNFYYLIGLVIVKNSSVREFSFWADSQDDQVRIWEQLVATIKGYSDVTLLHYGSYETKFLASMSKKYEISKPGSTKRYFTNSLNVLSVIYANIYFPTYSNSLKDIGTYLGARWTEANSTGLQSIVWRHKWEMTGKSTYKNKLIRYNLEDCRALKKVTGAIVGISNADVEYNAVSVEDIKPEFSYNFHNTGYLLKDLDFVNKCSYFDYQREKVYLRTDTTVKEALKNRRRNHRNINKIDKVLDLSPENCPGCNKARLDRTDTCDKVVIDLQFVKNGIKKKIVKYKGYRCRNCGKTVVSEGMKDFPRTYGHNLISWLVNNNVTHNIDWYKLQRMLLESFGLQMDRSVSYKARADLCEQYRSTFLEIQQDVLQGKLIHADETSVRVKGFASPYVWVFTNMQTVFYIFKPNRKADFIKELLTQFGGVLVSDFYPGYDALPCPQQKCLAHLIRDLNQDLWANQFDEEFKSFVKAFGRLLRDIIQTVDKYGLKKIHLRKHNRDVDAFFKRVINKEYKGEPTSTYKKRFKKYKGKLFTFLNYDGIPWNNNNAEHAVKSFAYHRTNVKGNFTQRSLNELLILLSIQQTCRYRGVNFLDFLRSKERSIDRFSRLSRVKCPSL
jgi:hypothetical protein